MPDSPSADIAITADVVDALATSVFGDAARPLPRRVASGWDNEMWRIGDDHVVRVPRRASAAQLIIHEAWVLPRIADARVPRLVHVGAPQSFFPFPWLVESWHAGSPATDIPRSARAPWAAALAEVTDAVHAVPSTGGPRNPVRGCPLSERADVVLCRCATLSPRAAAVLSMAFRAGLAAPQHGGAPVTSHGDPHPGNIIVDDGRLTALIDFGDVGVGDPAVDLAAGWLVFDAPGRASFRAALATHDEATWTRARAWAAVIASALLTASDDRPDLLSCGRETLAELAGDVR